MSTASVNTLASTLGNTFVSYLTDTTIIATLFGFIVGFYAVRWALRKIRGAAKV